MNRRILFIGGDKRMLYARDILGKRFCCDTLGLSEENAPPVGRYGCVILPFPASRDGQTINAPLSEKPLPLSAVGEYTAEGAVVFSGGIPEELSCCGARLYDYSADETLTLQNAMLTAEAAAALLSQSTDGAVFGSSVLITGYGRVARYTARVLSALGAAVTVLARKEEQRALARLDFHKAADFSAAGELISSADYVVNTVPARALSEQCLAQMKHGAVYMELATFPAEPTKSLCERFGALYIHAAGLPGRYSPKKAGELIAQAILRAFEQGAAAFDD